MASQTHQARRLSFKTTSLLAGVRGLDAHRKTNQQFWKSMPDFQFKVVNIAANGDFVATELVGAGTSTGPTELPDEIQCRRRGARSNLGLLGSSAWTPTGSLPRSATTTTAWLCSSN